MYVPRNLGSFAAALACINLLVPLQLVQAANPPASKKAASTQSPPTASRPVTRDVKLGAASDLRGQLVDKNGVRLAKRIVVAVHADKTSLETVSDANGQFRFAGAKPGMYQIASERSYQVCRCWAVDTAPPKASPELLMVEGDVTLRGQRPIGELLSGPVLIGLIIAAAIIIPIAVHNSQKSAS
jgi:hypothetical protein